jgi:hypothetical protein
MEVDDFNQLTEFVFDQSTPESDEEARVEESREAPPPLDSAPRERIIRRRARKACVACHKRYFLLWIHNEKTAYNGTEKYGAM